MLNGAAPVSGTFDPRTERTADANDEAQGSLVTGSG